MLVVESVTGAVPVPLRLTVCGLLIALSAKLTVPVVAPSAVGEKLTPTVQVAPAAMLAPHVLLAMANGPVALMLVNVSAVLSRLVTVTVFAALMLPTASEPKLKAEEESVTGEVPKTTEKAIVSVKGGDNVNVAMVRDLGHVVDREKAKMGVFITLADSTGPMRTEAVKAGFYETPYGKFPKLQIMTIAELFEGERPKMPWADPGAFKKAAKEIEGGEQNTLPF